MDGSIDFYLTNNTFTSIYGGGQGGVIYNSRSFSILVSQNIFRLIDSVSYGKLFYSVSKVGNYQFLDNYILLNEEPITALKTYSVEKPAAIYIENS